MILYANTNEMMKTFQLNAIQFIERIQNDAWDDVMSDAILSAS